MADGLALDRVWLMDVADPDSVMPLLRRKGRSFGYEMDGRVERYAGGRLRARAAVGAVRTAELVVNTDAAGLVRLQAWADGRTLLYRDGLGGRFFCAMFAAPWEPSEDGKHRIVTLELTEVTHVEAV